MTTEEHELWQTVATRVKSARIQRGFSVAKLATFPGVSLASVRALEFGHSSVPLNKLFWISRALRVRLSWLVGGDEE